MKCSNVKKLLGILLSATMMLSMAACGDNSQESSESSKSSESNKSSESASSEEIGDGASSEEGTEEKNLEPITFTFGILDTSYGDGIHTDEYPVLKAIQEATGVTLDFVTYDNEKFGLLIAGEELPDILCAGDSLADWESFITSGQILQLNDLLDQYGQNIKNASPNALSAAAYKYDGAIYYMPVHTYYTSDIPADDAFIGMRARYDLYKEIGHEY